MVSLMDKTPLALFTAALEPLMPDCRITPVPSRPSAVVSMDLGDCTAAWPVDLSGVREPLDADLLATETACRALRTIIQGGRP